jgi:hypothetical protein
MFGSWLGASHMSPASSQPVLSSPHGCRFQRQQEKTTFKGQILFSLLLGSHLLVSIAKANCLVTLSFEDGDTDSVLDLVGRTAKLDHHIILLNLPKS